MTVAEFIAKRATEGTVLTVPQARAELQAQQQLQKLGASNWEQYRRRKAVIVDKAMARRQQVRARVAEMFRTQPACGSCGVDLVLHPTRGPREAKLSHDETRLVCASCKSKAGASMCGAVNRGDA